METDIFDYVEEEEEQQSPANTDMVWNILTIVVLVMTLCVGIVFLTVFINPNVGLNPFPPPTMPQAMAFDTPTPTPKQILPPTWTATTTAVSPTETPSPTLAPTGTIVAGVTATTAPEGGGEQPQDEMAYVLDEGNPQAVPNIYYPSLGCNWMSVAGRVLTLNGAPVTGAVVELQGQLAGETIDRVTLSGTASHIGTGGYEFDLTEYGNGPIASSQSLWLQILGQAGNPLSEKIYFDTYESCDKNTILIFIRKVK